MKRLKPYEVEAPLLLVAPDPSIEYFEAIKSFASERLEVLAKRTIHRMQRIGGSGIFRDEAKNLRSLWDDFCWHHHQYGGDVALLSDAVTQTAGQIVQNIVEEIMHAEAVLISCAVCEDQSVMPARSDADICEAVLRVVAEAAGRRSMDRFEEESW